MQLRRLVLALMLFGCEDATQTKDPDLSVETLDMTTPGDGGGGDAAGLDLFRPDIGSVFCQQSCIAPEACCVVQSASGTSAMCTMQASCPDGGVFAACTSPSQCAGTTPNCCVTINITADEDAGMGSSSTGAVAQCTAACPGGLMGMSEFRTQLCDTAADCSGYSGIFGPGVAEPFDGCCSSARAASVYFCAPTQYAGPDSYTCM